MPALLIILSLLVAAAVASVARPMAPLVEQSCKYPTGTEYRPGQRVRGSQFDGVVVTWGQWVPASTDVERAEDRLPAFIAANAGAAPLEGTHIPSELSQYYRQYCGVKANPRQIQILFAHRSSPDASEWLRGQPLGVFDGGEYYFEVTYEVATGRFGSLSVNTNF